MPPRVWALWGLNPAGAITIITGNYARIVSIWARKQRRLLTRRRRRKIGSLRKRPFLSSLDANVSSWHYGIVMT